MNENLELLEYIYQTADMGTKSLTDLLNDLKDKDNKIKSLVACHLKEYEKYLKESEKLIKKHKVNPKEKSLMAEVMSKVGIKKEVLKDNSDSAIASMLMEGYLMGNTEMEKKISTYTDKADKDIIKLAKDLKKFGEKAATEVKEYL